MLRRSELVALTVDHLTVDEDGTGAILVRKSKTDQEGRGAVQFLSIAAVEALTRYIAANDITEGQLFRRFIKGRGMGENISSDSVAKAFKRLAVLAGVDAENISGHSARVGMAQDLTAAGADLPAIMQAGRWKSATMPARYGERLAIRRGAVARFYDSR
jgi:site-specific recombinase XerD